VDLHADRQQRFDLRQPFDHLVANFNDIGAVNLGHADGYGFVAVMADQPAWPFRFTQIQGGNIRQPDHRRGAGPSDDEILDPAEILKSRWRHQADTGLSRDRGAIGLNAVFRIKDTDDVGHGNTKARHLVLVDIQIDDVFRFTGNLNLSDAGNRQQLPANTLHRVSDVAIGVAIGGECVKKPINIAEAVIDKRCSSAGRQISDLVVNLAAQFVPDLRQLSAVIRRFDFNADA